MASGSTPIGQPHSAPIGQLIYQSSIGKQKPVTLQSRETPSACPFCDPSLLPPILRKDGDILLVPNKYPILKGSQPYVLIETADCASELSLYTQDRLIRVFRMAFDLWREMLADERYRSVMFIKNHGPMSGGSLRHPHMQLIGLYDIDFMPTVFQAHFRGPVIHQAPGVQLNVSDRPRVGFIEFNAILSDEDAFDAFCALIQKAVQYTLWHFHNKEISSYNLFFYALDGKSYCKVMPRYATTPVYMGYAIPQVLDDLDEIVRDFRAHCFA